MAKAISLHLQDDMIWKKKDFPDRNADDEDLVLIAREDISVLILKSFKFAFTFLFLLIIRLLLNVYVGDLWILYLADLVISLLAGCFLIAFTLLFHDYYLSLQIVTNRRVIDIDQKGLFSREVNQLPIANIQDVTHTQTGFWGTMLNFGNVIVQSSGANMASAEAGGQAASGFVFNNVPAPSEIANEISNLVGIFQKTQQENAARLNAEYLHKVLKS